MRASCSCRCSGSCRPTIHAIRGTIARHRAEPRSRRLRAPLHDERRRERRRTAGREGAFIACSFWLVDALALTGRRDELAAMFERVLSVANDVGLLSEEYDLDRRRLVGNFPQAFSHVAVINSARVARSSRGGCSAASKHHLSIGARGHEGARHERRPIAPLASCRTELLARSVARSHEAGRQSAPRRSRSTGRRPLGCCAPPTSSPAACALALARSKSLHRSAARDSMSRADPCT